MGVTIPNYATLYPNLASIDPYSVRTTPVTAFYTLTSALYSSDGQILPNPVSRLARLVLPINESDLRAPSHPSFLLQISGFTGVTVEDRTTSPLRIFAMQVPCP